MAIVGTDREFFNLPKGPDDREWFNPDIVTFANKCDVEGIKSCLALGVLIDKCNEAGINAIHQAVRKKYRYLVEFLLKEGADPNQIYRGNYNLLHTAAYELVYDVEIYNMLINAGTDKTHKNILNRTPLHIVCFGMFPVNIVDILFDETIMNHVDKFNRTPLDTAFFAKETGSDNQLVIDFLIGKGAKRFSEL